uniref:Epididymal sperm-binding protein 1-like n=1 Tax=Pogona vitticeps TaxID=103695 RepID=A0ABM5GSD1_9SAUR
MASSFIFFIWAFLLLSAACQEPPPCVFPFIYRGMYYPSCTTEGTGQGRPWCATTENYDRDRQWRPCAVTEYGGNTNGQPCVFPYLYLGRAYYTCNTKFSRGRFWCSTTGSYDKDKRWSFCADTRLGANYPTQPCAPTFTYDGKLYSGCTTAGRTDGKLWCSLSSNYEVDPRGLFCEPSEPAPCYFPFVYKNKSYYSCIREGPLKTQLWCATTPNYDTDSRWKACSSQEYGGNSNGQPCVFPFTYKNQTFETCTNVDEMTGNFWCATTENYDQDQKWSFCPDTNLGSARPPLAECVFPFIYRGKSYSDCTEEDSVSWKPWCSLTSNYDVDRKWKYCEPTDLQNQNTTLSKGGVET